MNWIYVYVLEAIGWGIILGIDIMKQSWGWFAFGILMEAWIMISIASDMTNYKKVREW